MIIIVSNFKVDFFTLLSKPNYFQLKAGRYVVYSFTVFKLEDSVLNQNQINHE